MKELIYVRFRFTNELDYSDEAMNSAVEAHLKGFKEAVVEKISRGKYPKKSKNKNDA